MARAVLEIVLDSKGNIQAIKQAGEELDKFGKGGKKAGESLEGLGRVAAFAGGVIATIKSAQAAVEFVELGASVQAAEARLEAFAGGADQARSYMAAFNEATDGTVDRMSGMGSASKLLGMGLVENADELAAMAEMATKLGDQTMNAGDRINDFALLLANQSVQRLDNFNISSGRTRQRIDELLKSGQALARDEAFKMAVMEIGAASVAKLGDTSDSTRVKIDKIKSAVADAKTGFAEMAVGALEGAGGVDDLTTRIRRLPEALGQVLALQRAWTRAQQEFLMGGFIGGAIDEFNNTLKQHAMTMVDVRSASEEVRYAYTVQAEAVSGAEVAAGKLSQAQAAMAEPITAHVERQSALEFTILSTIEAINAETEAAQRAAQSQLDLAAGLKGATEAQIAQAAIGQLKGALESDQISFETYATAVAETQIAFGLADEESVALAAGLVGLTEMLAAGEIKAGDYNEALEGLIRDTNGTTTAMEEMARATDTEGRKMRDLDRAIKALPDQKVIEVIVEYKTRGKQPDDVSVPQSMDWPRGAVGGVRPVPVDGFGAGRGGTVVQITNYFGRGSVRTDADVAAITQAQERSATLRGVRLWEM